MEKNIDIKKFQREQRIKTIKSVIRFAAVGLVETFIGAVTTNVVNNVEGGRLAKFGAKAGGFLTGIYIGDTVADYICTGIDDMLSEVDDLKRSMEDDG